MEQNYGMMILLLWEMPIEIYNIAGGSISYCPDYPPACSPVHPEAPVGWPNCDAPVIKSRIIPTGSGK